VLARINANSVSPKTGELSMLSRGRVFSSEIRYRRDAEIYGEAEPAEFIYQIVEGAVRSYKVLSDGRRQIGAFHLRGDIFGLENGNAHRFTTEAIVDTTVWLLKRRALEDLAEGDASVARDLIHLTTKNLQHAEDHMLLLGRKTAPERVVAFLCEMDSRLSSAAAMTLPMYRRDIADYLGLTIETVSRALSMLRDMGILSFKSQTQREIVLLDRSKLAWLADQAAHKFSLTSDRSFLV
jgi:CRP/FNR family nitrogen fixation transcriptional regulator